MEAILPRTSRLVIVGSFLLLMMVNGMKTFRKSFHQLKNIHYLCIR